MWGRKMTECALPKCEGTKDLGGRWNTENTWTGASLYAFQMQWLIFSDQRHMKHVCIFYKLETQGITLQLEDQKAGERETTRETRLNPDSRTHSPDSSPPHQDFSLFLPFLFFSFLPCFLFPFKGLFLELSMVPSENRGGPGRNVCLNGSSPRGHHSVTFLWVAQL